MLLDGHIYVLKRWNYSFVPFEGWSIFYFEECP